MARWLVILAVAASLTACGSHRANDSSASNGCESILPTTSVEGEGYEVHMTVAMQPEPVTFELEPHPSTVCPGGDVRVELRAHNAGPEIENFRGQLSLGCGGMVKMMVAAFGPISVPEGDSKMSVEFKAPAAECRASISVYGYAGSAQLAIGSAIDAGVPTTEPPFTVVPLPTGVTPTTPTTPRPPTPTT